MKVKVTVTSHAETENQDKFLKSALEKLAWDVGDNADRRLVLDVFKARAVISNLTVESL